MKKRCNVLVTGASNTVGQAIIKSLKISKLPLNIFAADISKNSVGFFLTKKFVLIPKVEKKKSLKKILSVCRKCKINLLFVGSELELPFFSRHKKAIEKKTNTKVVISPYSTVLMSNDKWLTYKFFLRNKIKFPNTCRPKNIKNAQKFGKIAGYPLILKPRVGTSSKYIYIIRKYSDLKRYFYKNPLPLLQKIITLPSSRLKNEYTCSIFKTFEGKIVGPFIARRFIRNGDSWCVEVKNNRAIENLMIKLAKSINFLGPLNVQLMLTKNGPIPFEINCRFSGTTAIRAFFGFNEPKMAVLDLFYKTDNFKANWSHGFAYRFLDEAFLTFKNETQYKYITKTKGIKRWCYGKLP